MHNVIIPPHRRQERGQTVILVAVAIVSLLAMAALAIDVVTLYVARSEIQRAADATALAGAKGLADSGVTTLQPTDPKLPDAKVLAQSMALAEINAFLNASSPTNLVAGTTPTMLGTPNLDWTQNNNPRITVTVQRANLPTFFARILGQRSAIATASATAEAYNPANVSPFTLIAPRGVKPWLVANADPINGGIPFITTATGLVEPGVIGESFDLTADCDTGNPNKCKLIAPPPPYVIIAPPIFRVYYLPALVASPPNAANICPSSCTGNSDYEQSIQCYDTTVYSCGGGAANASWDNSVNPGANGANALTAHATECLIHATGGYGPNAGQDTLSYPPPYPLNGAPQITAQSGPQIGNLVTTSNSIVTIPIIDTCSGCIPTSSGPVTVVGFLQAFINWVEPNGLSGNPGDVNITVLNVAGCSSAAPLLPPVVGGMGTSPVPVRLITPP